MTEVLIILALTLLLFVWGKYPPDLVALLSMLALFFSGILDLKEALSGFSNPTVIMIAGLFVVGEGLARTGWTALAGQKFVQWARRRVPRLLFLITAGAGVLSGFVSNTGTVAALLPVSVTAAWAAGTFPSKLLLPLAFGSNTGGLLTLTGTPPNIIVSNTLLESGYTGFSFFEFSLIGLPLLIILLIYMATLGYRLLPARSTGIRPANINVELSRWIEDYSIGENLYRLRVRSMSELIDTRIGDWDFEKEYRVSVMRLKRRFPKPLQGVPPFVELPGPETDIRYHDIITVKGKPEDVDRLIIRFSLGVLPFGPEGEQDFAGIKEELINQEVGMVEMLITPRSVLVDRTINLGQFLTKFNVQLLAARRGTKALQGQIKIQPGDSFIIRGTWEDIEKLDQYYEHVVISGTPEALAKDVASLNARSYVSLAIAALMILMFVLDVFPGAVISLICAGLMLFTGCVPMGKAYKSIGWSSLVMIAAMIPMGLALTKTGAAQLAAETLVSSLGSISPIALLAGIFILTSGFSQSINNSATAVLMAPIAMLAAESLGLSPRPFLMMVAVSASTAFLTPIGTTTNAMVLTAGAYKFTDYVRVGAPLMLLFLITSLILVPWIWSP